MKIGPFDPSMIALQEIYIIIIGQSDFLSVSSALSAIHRALRKARYTIVARHFTNKNKTKEFKASKTYKPAGKVCLAV